MSKRINAALTLTAFRAAGVEHGADGAALPSRLLVAPLGEHDGRERGKIVISTETLTGLAARQAAVKIGPRIALDFEHNTVPGTPAFAAESEPRRIAAWGTLKAVDGLGIVLEDLEWTPAGAEAYKGRAYQDISPAVFRRADGTVLALHSVGLVRHGEIDGLTLEAAAAPRPLAPFFAALSAYDSPPSTDPMKPTPALIALLGALGVQLTEDADEATLNTAIESAAAAIDKLKSEITDLSAAAEVAKKAEPEGMSALREQLATLGGQVTALTAERDQVKRERLLDQAKLEGKVIPLSAEQIKLTPLSVLETLVTAAKPGEVPLGKQTTGKETKVGVDAFTAESVQVFDRFGLKPEDVAAKTAA
jgi:phage I-like protein